MPSHAKDNPITKEQAIDLAQSFVKDNGYTIVKPNKAKFKEESLERSKNIDDILNGRHNSLKAKALKSKPYGTGWMVIFEYKKPPTHNKNVGRAVIVGQFGKSLKMAHQDAKLIVESKK